MPTGNADPYINICKHTSIYAYYINNMYIPTTCTYTNIHVYNGDLVIRDSTTCEFTEFASHHLKAGCTAQVRIVQPISFSFLVMCTRK